MPVSVPGATSPQEIAGSLCLPEGEHAPDLVQVLVPGSTYNRNYWMSPVERASYAKAMTDRGRAVFALDRLNTGASTSVRPATAVPVDLDAATIHQVISALRAGGAERAAFDRVVLAGHSLGSVITVAEASTYHDVDGVILTGYTHNLHAPFAAALATGKVLVPAASSGGTSPYTKDQPIDELSTPDGARARLFYDPAQADPEVIAADEATKDIITLGELATFASPTVGPQSELINVPVLLVEGQRDQVFACGTGFCDDEETVRRWEGPRFLGTPDLEVFVQPEAGHDMALATNATTLHSAVDGWLNTTFS